MEALKHMYGNVTSQVRYNLYFLMVKKCKDTSWVYWQLLSLITQLMSLMKKCCVLSSYFKTVVGIDSIICYLACNFNMSKNSCWVWCQHRCGNISTHRKNVWNFFCWQMGYMSTFQSFKKMAIININEKKYVKINMTKKIT